MTFIRVTMLQVRVLWTWVFLGGTTVPIMAQERVLPKPRAISKRTIEEPHLYCHSEKCQHEFVKDDDEWFRRRFDSWYTLDGNNTIGADISDTRFIINCGMSGTLNSDALPSAKSALQIPYLSLRSCAMPSSISLAELFAKMNVSLKCNSDSPDESQSTLNILGIKSPPRLTAKHFNGFECLSSLKIEGSVVYWAGRNRNMNDNITEKDFLAPLQNLKSLELKTFRIPVSELDVLKSLEHLEMKLMYGIEWLPLIPGLKTLKLTDWIVQRPLHHDKDRCNSLRELRLIDLTAEELPDGWLTNCSRLEVFEIEKANITTLPPKLLVGTSSLTELTIQSTALETLPLDLLDYSPKLQRLILAYNKLHTISR